MPKLFTYELFLEANPESNTGKLVRIRNADQFWLNVPETGKVEFVQKGDQVQFVVAPEIASEVEGIEIEFQATKSGAAEGPFGSWEKKITDSSPHDVTNNNTYFSAMCYLTTKANNGKGQLRHECAKGGKIVCPNPNNPACG